MGPLDYSGAFADTPSPLAAFTQGLQGGAMVRQVNAQQAQQQTQAQQQQAMRADLSALSQNPTAQAIGQMSIKYPQLSEGFKRSFDMLSPAQQQSKLDSAGPVHAAVLAGEYGVASKQLREHADALENSGNAQEAQQTRAMADLVDQHPETAKLTTGLLLAQAMGPDKYAAAFGSIGKESRDAEQAPADLNKKNADARKAGAEADVAAGTVPDLIAAPALKNRDVEDQIKDRSKRFALDQDKFETETKIKLTELKDKFGMLPEFVVKDQSAAVTSAIAAQQSAGRMTELADKIDSMDISSGSYAKGKELLKRLTGNQNEITRIRAEYSRIVTPAAMEAYKKNASGSTSDKDIETAMLGVPGDTAEPSTMASFLRGAAKLQRYESVLNNAKSEWLGEVKGLGKAKGDIEVDGIKVASGTTFKQFADAYVEKKIKLLDAGEVAKRSYMKYAAPATPQAGGASGNY